MFSKGVKLVGINAREEVISLSTFLFISLFLFLDDFLMEFVNFSLQLSKLSLLVVVLRDLLEVNAFVSLLL